MFIWSWLQIIFWHKKEKKNLPFFSTVLNGFFNIVGLKTKKKSKETRALPFRITRSTNVFISSTTRFTIKFVIWFTTLIFYAPPHTGHLLLLLLLFFPGYRPLRYHSRRISVLFNPFSQGKNWKILLLKIDEKLEKEEGEILLIYNF